MISSTTSALHYINFFPIKREPIGENLWVRTPDGKEVDAIGRCPSQVLRGLHRGNVRVDEHDLDSFLLQRFDGLRSGIIEFASLSQINT